MTAGVDDTQLEFYEGLVRATAARVFGSCEMEFEDIAQELRIKVYTSLQQYDPARSTVTRQKFIFSCVLNRSKDLLKYGGRRRRAGVPHLIEDITPDEPARDRFEARYLSVIDAFLEIEEIGIELPASLVGQERELVLMLHLDYSRGEIARELGISEKKVRAILGTVRAKMAHLAPAA